MLTTNSKEKLDRLNPESVCGQPTGFSEETVLAAFELAKRIQETPPRLGSIVDIEELTCFAERLKLQIALSALGNDITKINLPLPAGTYVRNTIIDHVAHSSSASFALIMEPTDDGFKPSSLVWARRISRKFK